MRSQPATCPTLLVSSNSIGRDRAVLARHRQQAASTSDVDTAGLKLFEAAAASVDIMQLLTGDTHPPSHAAGAVAAALRFLGYCTVSGRLAYQPLVPYPAAMQAYQTQAFGGRPPPALCPTGAPLHAMLWAGPSEQARSALAGGRAGRPKGVGRPRPRPSSPPHPRAAGVRPRRPRRPPRLVRSDHPARAGGPPLDQAGGAPEVSPSVQSARRVGLEYVRPRRQPSSVPNLGKGA